jgi:hypothetical protein
LKKPTQKPSQKFSTTPFLPSVPFRRFTATKIQNTVFSFLSFLSILLFAFGLSAKLMPKALELLFSPPQKSRNRFRIATIPFDKIGETPLKTPHFDIFL